MTLATRITVLRIALIPVFVVFAAYYGKSVEQNAANESLRFAAIAAFIIASVTDCLDGWVARRFGEVSKLGTVLDPLADKGLLLTAIITLSVTRWPYALPLWFPVLVVARDVVILVGCLVVKHFEGHLEVRPSWMGKFATALQMVTLAWVMLQFPFLEYPTWLAGLFTLASGAEYLIRGGRQLTRHDTPLASR